MPRFDKIPHNDLKKLSEQKSKFHEKKHHKHDNGKISNPFTMRKSAYSHFYTKYIKNYLTLEILLRLGGIGLILLVV